MILGIAKKLIYSSFLFINFIHPSKSVEFKDIIKSDYNGTTKLSWSELTNRKTLFNNSNLPFSRFHDIYIDKKLLKKYSESLIAVTSEKQSEIIIQSDQQSEVDGVIYAEGNVIVESQGKILKADNLIYNKTLKTIRAKGNILLVLGEQIFESSELEYSFLDEKGYLKDVKGLVNSNNLIDDLSSNFNSSDFNTIESSLEFKKEKVLHTPAEVQNWLFFADKITIDGEKWKSKKALFSNDLLESKQVKIVINSLEVIPDAERLRFKSSLNYLIFDEKVSIPFWVGDRTLNKSGGIYNFDNRWNVGYENLEKDGYFIGRKFNPIEISDNFVFNLEPQFLIQRSLKGYTKSFVKRAESITSDRVKRNTSFEDYFALKSQLKGGINNWDLEIEKNVNSFDFGKFSDAFRLKTKLSKEINFLDSIWNKSFYGIYRERIWNGSLGESEIYSGYGAKLQKENAWVVNGINKREILSLGLADITAEALNTKNLETHIKSNLFYALDQRFPVSVEYPKNKFVDISYKYIPEPITKGLVINTRLEASYSLYENGDHQDYLGIGIGPELTLGNFKNKTFDYTRVSFFPFYRFNSGESAFKFDQNNDNFTLGINFDQQLFGPVILKSFATLNLTNDSDKYGEFINSQISLNWKKRTYEFGIYFQPHNQSGGINFSLFGFK